MKQEEYKELLRNKIRNMLSSILLSVIIVVISYIAYLCIEHELYYISLTLWVIVILLSIINLTKTTHDIKEYTLNIKK